LMKTHFVKKMPRSIYMMVG